MVVDTSAIVAILFGEADGADFAATLQDDPVHLVSAVTRVELSLVVEGRKGPAGRADLERFLEAGQFQVVSVTSRQALVAIDAWRRFGKGRHPASLNMGDCFSYALASVSGHDLLCKGADFVQTDVRVAALAPNGP